MGILLKKYNSLSEPAKASIWFTLCNVLQKGILFLTTPIFTRMLSTAEYGKYTIFISWYSIIAIFTTLNLSAGVYNKGLIKYENKYALTSSFLGLSSFISLCALMLYLPFRTVINGLLDLSTEFVILILIESIFEPAFLLWSVKERFDYKYQKLVLITVLMAVLNPGLGIILILSFGEYAIWRVRAYVVVNVVVGMFIGIGILAKGKKLFDKEYWTYALRFNLPLIPHYLSMTLLNQVDRLMINSMVGASEAAIYSIAYTISIMMNIITTAINGSFIPFTYKAIKDGVYEKIKSVANQLLVLIFVLCSFTMLFGPELIWVVGGEKYMDAVWIIPPVAASVFFMFLYPLFGNIEFYYEKTNYVMFASCVGSIAKIISNYVSIPRFGYISAGYTTLICYMLFSFAHYMFYKKILRENGIKEDMYNIKNIIFLSVLMIVLTIGMTILYFSTILRYSIIIGLVIVAFLKRTQIMKILKNIKN